MISLIPLFLGAYMYLNEPFDLVSIQLSNAVFLTNKNVKLQLIGHTSGFT